MLILGEPGSGKTTIIREIAALLAERRNVLIVDTSNEIGGDGDLPHPCVGYARRMMVPALNAQQAVMVECVQNHCPHVMVIDEIGREAEVDAARTVKQRGVRMVASAHGSLRQLMKNPRLKGLLGGFEHVILPGGIPKTKRIADPTFDCVIEVQRGRDAWVVITDVAQAVDDILEGRMFAACRRAHDSTSGAVTFALISA